MSTEISQVKDTIRKLLNLANNAAATDGEVNNAIKFAQRLLTAHHLSEDEIHSEEPPKMGKGMVYASGARADAWEQTLASFTSKFIGSVGVYNAGKQTLKNSAGFVQTDPKTGEPKKRVQFIFYGLDDETQLAQDIYNSLSQTITTMSLLKYGSPFRLAGRDYANGFVSGLFTKVKDEKEKLMQESSSTALVVQSDKMALAKLERAKSWLGIKLRKNPTKLCGVNRGQAYAEGRDDGQKTDISMTARKKLT